MCALCITVVCIHFFLFVFLVLHCHIMHVQERHHVSQVYFCVYICILSTCFAVLTSKVSGI